MIADEAEAAFGLEAFAVEGDDARRLLPAMLQRVQAERGQRGGVRVAIDAEHAALLAQPVGVQLEIEIHAHWLLSCPLAGFWVALPLSCAAGGCWSLPPVLCIRLSSCWLSLLL